MLSLAGCVVLGKSRAFCSFLIVKWGEYCCLVGQCIVLAVRCLSEVRQSQRDQQTPEPQLPCFLICSTRARPRQSARPFESALLRLQESAPPFCRLSFHSPRAWLTFACLRARPSCQSLLDFCVRREPDVHGLTVCQAPCQVFYIAHLV